MILGKSYNNPKLMNFGEQTRRLRGSKDKFEIVSKCSWHLLQKFDLSEVKRHGLINSALYLSLEHENRSTSQAQQQFAMIVDLKSC